VINKEKGIGTIVVVLTPQDQTPVEKIADEIINFKKNSEKAVLTIFIGGERIRNSVLKLERNGIPNFSFPNQCLNALHKYYVWSRRERLSRDKEEKINELRQAKVMEMIEMAKKENRSAMFFSEARKITDLYGIKTIEAEDAEKVIKNKIKVKYPAVLKIDSDKVLHKTEKQGVALDIKKQKELEAAVKKMRKDFPQGNLIVQPMLSRQTELIIGLKNDPVTGPVIVYGLGGIYTEIFKMVDFLIPPVSVEEAGRSLATGKLAFLFEETRGQKPYNLSEMAEIISGLSQLSREIKSIKELDVNPLLAYNDGKESVAVDVKIVI
jgi:acyl-CoA synthetase (NDP forming)